MLLLALGIAYLFACVAVYAFLARRAPLLELVEMTEIYYLPGAREASAQDEDESAKAA